MRTFMTISLIVLFLAALAAATGCEDTPLTPGADSTMTVVANPQTLVFQPTDTELTSLISAVIVDEAGVPLPGAAVLFSTTSGSMSSNGNFVETDGSGKASDTLTVPDTGPATVTVTATAGAISETVNLTKTDSTTNNPPVARIVTAPTFEQVVNGSIELNGSSSTDPDSGDGIASYSWRITSPTEPEIMRTGVSTILSGYPTPQALTITLTVEDSRGLPGTTSMTYQIVTDRSCAHNTAPVAVIGGPESLTRNGPVRLDDRRRAGRLGLFRRSDRDTNLPVELRQRDVALGIGGPGHLQLRRRGRKPHEYRHPRGRRFRVPRS